MGRYNLFTEIDKAFIQALYGKPFGLRLLAEVTGKTKPQILHKAQAMGLASVHRQ